ncbi:hypothetical protein GKQ38_03340 [Candidatus Nanohaloarchaea archaeon]|nr:hypothetical protein GKQ38_03340 [Candidatus Nanohaloarchaea archaeon]
MTAMWFTVTAVWLSIMNGEHSLGLELVHLFGGSLLVAVLVNIWNIRREQPVMDERKQRLVTNAMAWAFVVIAVGLLVASKMANQPFDAMTDLLEFGFWTWLIVISGTMLWQKYGRSEGL